MGMAIALLLMLGSVFAAPSGTVILDPLTATRSGLPGTTVTYTLWITNSGGTAGITDTFKLGYEGSQWPVDLSMTEILLPGSAGTDVVVSVTIPFTATATSNTVTITVSYQGSLLLPVSRLTTIFFRAYLPIISKPEDVCRPTGEDYGKLEINPWAATPPAESHPDLNLAIRGYVSTDAFLGLVDIGGTDPKAPQLAGLFATPRLPPFTAVYRVYDWLRGCNCRGDPIDKVEVSLAELGTTPGETIHVPDSGYRISPDYEVLVLYASQDRLTLKFTAEDTIEGGYAIHLENVCVDANLLALYQRLNAEGRHELPALPARKPVGRARSGHIGVVIRDRGGFLDPRWRHDWWIGY